MDSRNGEGLQYVWQLDLPLGLPTHKRRPARDFMGQRQNSQLQTELLEAIFSSTNLEAAYRRVKANGGAASVDDVSLEDFSNLVLNALDKELEARGHRFFRYADDFVVLVKSERAAHRIFANLCSLHGTWATKPQ